MKRKKKEEETTPSKIKIPVKETLQQLQPMLLKLATPETLTEEELKKPAMNVRSLAIITKHYMDGWDYCQSPYIRLAGNWLMENGFYPGGRVQVVALNGLLVICPEEQK